jgi:hypothetical protein
MATAIALIVYRILGTKLYLKLRQLRPVFIWCRKLDIGVHHPCELLLQALFMIASVLKVTSTTATKTITMGLFIFDLAAAGPPKNAYRPNFHNSKMNAR